MTPRLYPFQEEGVAALASRPCFWIADEMGLGKTCQVIRAAERTPHLRTLVVCPAMVRTVWVEEIRKWSLLDPYVREIRAGKQPTYLEVPGPGWWIISYAYARRYWKRFVGLVDRVVFDEVHALKNLDTKQTKELLGPDGLAHHMKSVWALTGTPSPNHPGEIYPIVAALGGLPSDVKTYDQFCRTYCYLDDQLRPMELRPGAPAERLKESLSQVMLRRTKDQVGLQLPPVTRSVLWVTGRDPTLDELAGSALSRFAPEDLRAAVEADRIKAMEAIEQSRFDILSAGISTLRVWVALRKRHAVLDLIREEWGSKLYGRLLVFGLHRDMLRWLSRRLPASTSPGLVDGNVSAAQRRWILQEWKAGNVRTLLGNMHASGTGLTLVEANQVLTVEPWWNEDINDQALARAHRIGQTRPVNLRYVMLEDEPFEKGLLDLLARKRKFNENLWKSA